MKEIGNTHIVFHRYDKWREIISSVANILNE